MMWVVLVTSQASLTVLTMELVFITVFTGKMQESSVCQVNDCVYVYDNVSRNTVVPSSYFVQRNDQMTAIGI